MDGVPIFNLVRETLPAVDIIGFRGVVNSTTNYILTAMEQGQAFDAALAEMQARGIAEADASLDIDGWDAAAKTAALANVLLGASLTPQTVERQGITPDTGRHARSKRERAGRRLKLVARARIVRDGASRRAWRPRSCPRTICWRARGPAERASSCETDLLDEIAIVQRGGGLTQTAYALLSDLVTIARDVIPRARHAASRAIASAPGSKPLIDLVADDGDRDGAQPRAMSSSYARFVLVDVVRRERHAFS